MKKKFSRIAAAVAAMFAGPVLGIVAEGRILLEGSGAVPSVLNVRSMCLKPYSITVATVLTQDDHAGRTGVFDIAAGVAVTLPRATGSGAKYRFVVKTTVTSVGDKIQVANADDVIQGTVFGLQDGGDTVEGWESASTSDTITLDGSTKGGIRGDVIELEDVATGLYMVTGLITQTGTQATPFSAAVS